MTIEGKILYVRKDFIYFSRGFSIYRMDRAKRSIELFSRLKASLLSRTLAYFHLTSRFFRLQVHHLVPCSDGFYVMYGKKLTKLTAEGIVVGKNVGIIGSRPLCVAVKDDLLYYGEYTSNPKRRAVGIFEYDGKYQRVVASVESVRHIHGVFFDPYTSSLKVTTGDDGVEAGIWELDCSLGKLHPILVGGQQRRAVQLLFDSQYIYFGSDTPLERNSLYKIDRATLEVTRLMNVSSSVFYGCKIKKDIYFSTAIEPSSVNTTKKAEVWRLSNCETPEKVLEFTKDSLSMKYLQYGQILFPINESEELWFYRLGVSGSGTSSCLRSL